MSAQVKRKVHLARTPYLTLIDALHTLLILVNYAEFSNDNELVKYYHYDMSRRSSRRRVMLVLLVVVACLI